MAEQENQTNVFADFTVTEPSVISNTPIQTSKESDVFSGFTITEPTETKPEDVFSGFTVTGEATKPQLTYQSTEQFTDAQKIRYGIDKQNTFFGNLFRVAKSGTQAAFDPDKDFKDYIKYNNEKEQLKLKQKYGELASGKYEDDTMVQAAAMATMMLDPFYIAAYMTPWGRAASATLKGVSALSGVTVGLDTALNNLATTGTIDAKSVGISAAAGATLGPLTVKAFGAIKSLLPSANTAQIQKIIGVVEGQKAKQLGISKVEFKKLQSIAGDKELLEINKQLQKAAKNWVAPIANETKLFNATEKNLQSRIKNLIKDTKDVEGLAYFKSAKDSTLKELQKTLKIKNKTLAEKTKEFNLKQKELWKQTAAQERKLTDLVAKRDYTILKKLKEQKSLTRNLAEGLISASIRPALGAGIGYAFGRLWGGDDANLNNWMLAGASLGALNKMIQRSGTVFATGEKNLLENIIYNNATKQAFQKVRELTATTTSTKLKAIGGETEKIGMKLFQELDSPVSKFSASAVSDKLKLDYSNRAFKLIAGTTQEEQAAAIRIVRGSKEKGTPKIQKLANDIRKYLTDFRKEYTDVGIGLRKEVVKGKKTITQRIDPIKDYFPRVWNWDEVKKDVPKFKKVLTQIFKNKKVKDPEKAAEDFYSSLSTHNEKGFYSKEAVTELINSVVAGKQVTAKRGLIRNLPLSDHIENDRVLSGTYGQVEKLLSQNGYLIDDIPSVFNKLITSSADSIAFARQFGPKGEILNDYIKNIVTKYKNLAGTTKFVNENNYAQKASKEIKLVMDSIDGFFGRYGQVRQGIVKSGAGILSTISNLNMLDRVTIASLGDLVQPFTNSSNFTSWIKGLSKTAIKAKNESGLAKNLGYAQSKEVEQSLLRTLTPLDDATNATNVMGAVAKTTGQKIKQGFKNPVRSANELGFKLMGLQWLTGFARRYAYNVGAVDAYASANKLAKYVQAGNSLSSAKGIRLTNDVGKYGINTTDALRIGRSNTFEDALKSKANKDLLNSAGITASNRDALIPQVSNRLLFTQSRDPLVRLMGQFMSWTLAKSAQTNKLLQRIENGDTKQLVKLLAGLPVYGGIQALREIAKYGEVQTDLETQTDKWYSEAVRLSGVSGTATELVLGRLTGPGSREPWYLFAPVFSILKDLGNIPKEVYKGNSDKALQIFSERIAPLPTWRRWIGKLFPDTDFITPVKETNFKNRFQFSEGDIVDENNTDAVIVDQPFLEEAEAIASKKTNTKQTSNSSSTGLYPSPKKKPTIEEQVNNLIPRSMTVDTTTGEGANIFPIDKKEVKKDYSKISDLEPAKKKWLIETAEKVYTINKDEIVPSDIILAINSGETGWGSSRFWKEGSNNLFNFQSFDDKEESIAAKESKAKIKKFKTQEDSIIQFLDWVQTKPSYEGVRKEIELYNEGKGSKENIIKAIAKTGFAEDKQWSNKITSILNSRIDGKHKKELESFRDSLSFDKKKFNIGGLAAKGITKLLTKNVNKNINKATSSMVAKDVNPGDTAITTTIGTYKKVDNLLSDLNKKSVHDFGAGIGIGTRQFKNKLVTSHEPFVPDEKILKSKIKFNGELFEGRVPDYKSFDDVLVKEGFSSKDAVVNLNVLNVISNQTERANLVKNIAQLIKKDGVAVITTRGDDVANQAKNSKNAIKFADGWIFGKGNKKTFQKGFSQKELESYVKYVLGDNYTIEKIPSKYKISSSGVIIRKNK
jgi:SAM-dependent methyltransferase